MTIEKYENITDRDNLIDVIKNLNKNAKNGALYINGTTKETALILAKYLYISYKHKPTLTTETSNGSINLKFTSDNRELAISISGYGITSKLYDKKKDEIIMEANDDRDKLCRTVGMVKLFYNNKVENMCLFTGSFNPPTIAHYHMIDFVMDAGEFDYIVFAAANDNFLGKKMKKSGGKAFPVAIRIKLLLAMTRDYPNVIVYGEEAGYTYNMLCTVKERYNPGNLYFVLGSDKLKEIERWGYHDKLLSEFCFYVHQRNDSMEYIQNECSRIFANTKYVIGNDDGQYGGISATMVREKMEKGEDYSELVPFSIYEELEYMKENNGWNWN